MSGPTRPIPIGHGHRSQRSSPINTTGTDATAAAHDGVSPTAMISQSCPVVNGHGAAYFGPRHVPPRAPVIGSLPEPSFMLGGTENDDMMPELMLPPPAQTSESGSAARRHEASVVQVASSCPVDIGFFRQGSPAQQRSWVPSPRASDEFDLSKSPALAMMSAMRQARRPSFDARRSDDSHSNSLSQSQGRPMDPHAARSMGIVGGRRISDPPFRAQQPSNSFVSTSHHFYGNDRMGQGDMQDDPVFGMDSLSLGGLSSASSSNVPRTGPDDLSGLPPRRPERRGSYDGGIFDFEDQ